MDVTFDLAEEEKRFLDHLAYETVQHRPSLVYRWCRDHGVEPHELGPLGEIRGYEYTLEPPKGSWSAPWQSASQFRERAKAAADFLRSAGKWDANRRAGTALPMNRHEREFYDLYVGEICNHYSGRACYLLQRHGITYEHLAAMWSPYAAAWVAIGFEWCYHIPPLPLDLDLACPWDSAEAMVIRIGELNGGTQASAQGRDIARPSVPRAGEFS